MDVSQYLEIFLDEAKEHLENLNTQILKLEQEPERDLPGSAFLKGNGRHHGI